LSLFHPNVFSKYAAQLSFVAKVSLIFIADNAKAYAHGGVFQRLRQSRNEKLKPTLIWQAAESLIACSACCAASFQQ
jgi:hypothetical protein